MEFEEDDEEGGAGAGSPDTFPARVPGRGSIYQMGKSNWIHTVVGFMWRHI